MADDRPDASPPARERGGFFAKVKRGLFMTHTEILEKLGTAVKKGIGIDESVLESLEEALLSSDVGAPTAAALAERVRERSSLSERKDLAGLREMLRSEIEGILAAAPRAAARADVPLHVTFLVGVNGSGKTTTAAKLAAREKESGRRSSWPRPTRSAPAPSTSSRRGPTGWGFPSCGTARGPIRRRSSSTRSPRRRRARSNR